MSHIKSGMKRVLVACVGNIFLGDDGFGVEVARELTKPGAWQCPEGVEIVDFGIRGVELAYSLLDEYDTLVLVDAVPRGGEPGTLYLLEPDLTAIATGESRDANRVILDSHSMDPLKVLTFAKTLGARPVHTLIVGCEPVLTDASDDYAEMEMCLSEPVRVAVGEAVKMVQQLVEAMVTDGRQSRENRIETARVEFEGVKTE